MNHNREYCRGVQIINVQGRWMAPSLLGNKTFRGRLACYEAIVQKLEALTQGRLFDDRIDDITESNQLNKCSNLVDKDKFFVDEDK